MNLADFDFKNFFVNDTKFVLEANIGESPETAVLIDNDDLDFLYQFDYEYWKNALHTRYEVLLDSLKARDNIRKSLEAQFIKKLNQEYPTREERQNISLESFVDFVNKFATDFNDYGQKKETSNKSKFLYWEKDFLQEYGDSFDYAKKINSRDFLKNIRYMILDYVVPFAPEKSMYPVKAGEDYVKDKDGNIVKGRFYINRLIQKLETNQGKKIPLSNTDLTLANLSKVLARREPMVMDNLGKYGFDMSRARTEEIGGTAIGKTRGFTFPQLRSGSSGLTKVFNDLMRLNYQRHMGPLPSDENFDSYTDMKDNFGAPALIYKKLDSKSRNIEDNLNLVNLKISIKNKIKNFVARNRTETNWNKLRDKGLYDIIDKSFSEEIEQGLWAGSSSRMINYIANKLPEGYKVEGVPVPQIAPGDKKDFVIRYVSNYQKISGNTPITEKFAEYFSDKQVEYVLTSRRGGVASPKILDGSTPDELRRNFQRLDAKLKKQIQDNLSQEDLEYFLNTGRLPLNLKDKKLIPGRFSHAPIILPFLKTTNSEGRPISVPLIRPGKYLSGFQGIKDGGSEVEYEPDSTADESEEQEDGQEDGNKNYYSSYYSSTPSTSDRTSVYISVDENGKEKETKIVDAAATDKYIQKTGVRGAYYTTRKNERGYGERRYGFSRWKKSDKELFLKVFSHPRYKQNYSVDDVITKYEQLFGKDVYNEVFDSIESPESFYDSQELIDGFPFKLSGFTILPENDRPAKKDDDAPDSFSSGGSINTNYVDASNLTIAGDNNGEIIGFYCVIKSIVKCLTLKNRVCNNDGYLGYRLYYLEDADRVQELHDKIVAEAVRTNIWKNFTSKTSAINSFCSIIGKLFQSDRLGQQNRKRRVELIGSASNEYFKKLLIDYENHLSEIKSKSSKPTTNKKKISILNLIDEINPFNDDNNDDDVVEWFFPGYKNKDQKEKGNYLSDTDNFSPSFSDWNKGQPPTDLKDLLTLVYENFSDGLPEEYKNKLIEKIKKEKEYLVGNGSDAQGVVGLESYIWSKDVLEKFKKQVQEFHRYLDRIYDADLQKLNSMPSVNISSDYEEEESEEEIKNNSKDLDLDTSDYLNKFNSYFNSLSPFIVNVLGTSNKVPFLRSNLLENPNKSNKTAEIISALDIILNINKRSSVLSLMNFLIESMEAPFPQIYKTTSYEKDFIKENRDSKSSDFIKVLYSLCINIYKLNDLFNDILIKIEEDIIDVENRNKVSVFIKQNFSEKESSKLFLVSNIYKNNSKALEYYNIVYKNIDGIVESLFQKLTDMNKPSVLRRIDINRLSSDENVDIGKLSSWQLIKMINSKNTELEKSNLAKKIKDFFLTKGRWNTAESFFKKYIDSKIR